MVPFQCPKRTPMPTRYATNYYITVLELPVAKKQLILKVVFAENPRIMVNFKCTNADYLSFCFYNVIILD